MDGCRDVPPGSLVIGMFTLFAQYEVQLARLDDIVECGTFLWSGCGHCPETPRSFLWKARSEMPQFHQARCGSILSEKPERRARKERVTSSERYLSPSVTTCSY